jgi:hypothetical protein
MPRTAITNDQRAALRRWYSSQYPKPRYAAVIEWFFSKYNHRLSQSTVSESLSRRWSHLDSPETLKNSSAKRQREAKWPLLEQMLADWHYHFENQGGSTSSEIILKKAKEIWPQIPQYSGKPCPDFSYGWLDNFKRRFGVGRREQHMESQSVREAEDARAIIRTACKDYSPDNVYIVDESGLFWRYTISTGLASQACPGVPKSKSRLSVTFCTNATGKDRLPLLFIGHAKQPKALRGLNVQALEAWWRNSPKAWMNTPIMVDWLNHFYDHMKDKKAILLMNKLSPHQSAVYLAQPPENIRIRWLPSSSTSLFQPLEQGIIQIAKHHYKKQLLQFCIQMYDQRQDPAGNISVYHAMKWLCHAWVHEVESSTIEAYFKRMTATDSTSPATPTDLPDLTALYHRTILAGRIEDALELDDFLNPADENPQVHEELVLEQLLIDDLDLESDSEALMEDEAPAPPVIATKQALLSIRNVILFLEQQEDTRPNDLQTLNRMEALIQTKLISG